MFGLFKKERPVQGLTGMGGGVGSNLVGGSSVESNGPFTISGGTVLTPGNGYKYHVFTTPGNLTTTPGPGCPGTIDMLIVAGGGSGAKTTGNPTQGASGPSGAGGGGIVYASSYQLTSHVSESQNFPVTVGQATPETTSNGSNGIQGNHSKIDLSVFGGPTVSNLLLQAMGGGRGVEKEIGGGPGGCGGGGTAGNTGGDLQAPPNGPNYPNCPGTVTIYGVAGHQGTSIYGSGGGGSGAGSAGEAPSADGVNYGGDGGSGQAIPAFPGPIIAPAVPNPGPFSANVTPTGIYCGGGGGARYNDAHGVDGTGGPGGGGGVGYNGIDHTGSGGGGGTAAPTASPGGAGGGGIVVIRY